MEARPPSCRPFIDQPTCVDADVEDPDQNRSSQGKQDERGPSSVNDEHWNRFKENAGETSDRRGGTRMGFSERIDTILNWTDQNSSRQGQASVVKRRRSPHERQSSCYGQ